MSARGGLRDDPRLTHAIGDLSHSVWPPSFSTASAPVAVSVLHHDRSQWLSPATLRAQQQRQLECLATWFETHLPWFAARLAAARSTRRQPDRLRTLPILTRREVQAQFAAAPSHPLPEGYGPAFAVHTSGSTGEPLTVWRTQVNLLHVIAQSMRWHLWDERDFGGRLATIRAFLPTRVEPDWGSPATLFARTGALHTIDIETSIERQLDLLIDFAPDSLIGYPSNVIALIAAMEARGITIPSLRRVRTLGETLHPHSRKRIEQGLLARVTNSYSTEECGQIALQCPQSGLLHIMAESVIVEVLDDAGRPCRDGETGRVIITDLHNFATPMIRYDTGDHAVMGPRQCPCGRGLPSLRHVLGRTRNMLVRPDGSRNWPIIGLKDYRAIAPVIQFQLIQHAMCELEMRLVVERPLTAPEEDALRVHLRRTLGDDMVIAFSYFDDRLPMGPRGKHEEFKNMMESPQ